MIAESNTIRTNYIKAKIDNSQKNSKCRLCGKRDETVNHISECCKLAKKKYKNWHDWVGEGNSLQIVQEREILQYEKMAYAQTRRCS